jgi:hypothetical protein
MMNRVDAERDFRLTMAYVLWSATEVAGLVLFLKTEAGSASGCVRVDGGKK